MWKQNTLNKPFTKIFWPIRCTDQKSGYLIGWNTRSFVACVVDIVTDVPLNELETILNKISFDSRMLSCPVGHPPRVLGEWVGVGKTVLPTPTNLHELDIWISMELLDSGDPYLRKIYCNEYKFQTSSQIVLYDDTPPYYYTSHSIRFDSTNSIMLNNGILPQSLLQQQQQQQQQQGKKSNSSNSGANSVFSPVASSRDDLTTSRKSKSSNNISDLESTLKQINCSNDIRVILQEAVQKYHLKQKLHPSSSSSSSSSSTSSLKPQEYNNNSFLNTIKNTLRYRKRENTSEINNTTSTATSSSSSSTSPSSPQSPLKNKMNINNQNQMEDNMFWIIQLISKITTFVLHCPIPFGKTLGELTTLGVHLENRLQTAKIMLCQWNHLKKKKKCWTNNNDDRVLYVDFWNNVFLMIDDVVLGICAGLLLNYLSGHVLQLIGRLNFLLNNDMLKSLILWLMGWPGGFKLNENLDKFLGRLVLYYIDKWNLITATISPHGITFLQIICLTGIFGLSFLISVLIDLFDIFTLHISVFYSVAARFYLLQLVLLNSLWNLFRGVKFNPLRKRIDSCDFDIYQLLLGTLLFTLIFFLFPTTAIYYFFFALFKSGVSFIKGLFALLLHLLKSFPLYNIFLHISNPNFLPGGVVFTVKNSDNINISSNSNSSNNQSPKYQFSDFNFKFNFLQPFVGKKENNNSQTTSPVIITTTTSTSNKLLNSPPVSPNLLSSTSSPQSQQYSHQRNLSGTLISKPTTTTTPTNLNEETNDQQTTSQNLTPTSSLNQKITTTFLNSTPKLPTHHHHRRNLSLSSTTSSPIPRVSTQLEITYVLIKIKPSSFISFFSPTVQLLQQTLKTYHPAKLAKCFFMGVPLYKIK
eukprot:gene3925-4901_t